MDEKVPTSDREQSAGDSLPVLRIRSEHGVLIGFLALIVSYLSYSGTLGRNERADRNEEHQLIRAECQKYTNDQVAGVRQSLTEHREWGKEVNQRQDKEIEWMRKAVLQVMR